MDVLTRPDLTMVVPTDNERHRLDALVEQLFEACAQASLSPDRIRA